MTVNGFEIFWVGALASVTNIYFYWLCPNLSFRPLKLQNEKFWGLGGDWWCQAAFGGVLYRFFNFSNTPVWMKSRYQLCRSLLWFSRWTKSRIFWTGRLSKFVFFFQINKLILFDWLQNKFSIIWKVFDKGQVCNSYRNRKSCVWKMNDWKSKVVLKYWNQNVTQIQFGRPPSGLSQSEYVKVQQICLEWLF